MTINTSSNPTHLRINIRVQRRRLTHIVVINKKIALTIHISGPLLVGCSLGSGHDISTLSGSLSMTRLSFQSARSRTEKGQKKRTSECKSLKPHQQVLLRREKSFMRNRESHARLQPLANRNTNAKKTGS